VIAQGKEKKDKKDTHGTCILKAPTIINSENKTYEPYVPELLDLSVFS